MASQRLSRLLIMTSHHAVSVMQYERLLAFAGRTRVGEETRRERLLGEAASKDRWVVLDAYPQGRLKRIFCRRFNEVGR
jgi:hypothetical protein